MIKAKKENIFFNQLSARRNRFVLAKYLIVLCFIVAAFSVYNLSFLKYKPYEKYVKKNNLSFRKDITDRHGNILATNLITYSLYVKSNLIDDHSNFYRALNIIFDDINIDKINAKLAKKNNNLTLIKRDITKQQKELIEQEGFIGVFFHEDIKRIYPHKNLFSHVIGYVDIDEKGLTGLEKSLNQNLISSESEALITSLDLDIQSIVKDELVKNLIKFNAKGATAIVMNVNNGEILSLVSLPDYDPYKPWISLKDRGFNNRASLNLHEMGSTFKIFTMALGLEHKKFELDEEFDVSESIKIDRFSITDHSSSNDLLSGRDIFVKSSNIGTAQIALRLEDHIPNFLDKLNLFKPLKLELVEKSTGQKPKRWRKSNVITASYGYGVSVTAIHLVQAVASIINKDQKFNYATLIKGKKTSLNEHIVSAEVSKQIREIMQQVVQYGTARRSKSFLYSIGGKTGTAHKIGLKGYDEKRLLSSFVSFFPVLQPEYIVYVNYDEPNGIEETLYYATGGVTSAPVAKNIIERIAPLLSVYPDKLL